MKYWEDLADSPIRRYGPVIFSSELLDRLLDLMGEKHPIHEDNSFAAAINRRQRIVPGGFIHSITSGWVVQHGSPAAIVGLRKLDWEFVRPIYPDTPFWFTIETKNAVEVNEKLGLLNSVRRVFGEEDRLHAIGRMSVVVQRRKKQPTDIDAKEQR